MLKIIFFADAHLGAKPYGLEEKRKDIYETFLNFLKYCKKSNPDLIIIAGDLFDSNETDQQTNLIASALAQFKDKIFFCNGNHDPELNYFMKLLGVNTSHIREIKLEKSKEPLFFIRLDYHNDHQELRNKIFKIRKDYGQGRTILVSHFNLKDKMPFLKSKQNYISYTDLRNFKFVMGGHIHNNFIYKNIAMPGSLERLDITNILDRGFYELEITDIGKIANIKFKIIETRRIIIGDNFGLIKKDITILNQLGKKKPIVFFTGNLDNIHGVELFNLKDKCLLFEVRKDKEKNKIITTIDETVNNKLSSTVIKDQVESHFKKRKVDKELINFISSTWGDKKSLESNLDEWIKIDA